MEDLSWGPKATFTGDIRRTFLCRGPEGEQKPDFSETDRQHLIDLYDAEIRYVDQSIGELFVQLKRQGIYDSALIILSSDHGESLGEHGKWMHGASLYDTEIHVPLIVKVPRQRRGKRVADAVQTIDIFPTVLDVLGIPAPRPLDGTILRGRKQSSAFTFWQEGFVARTGPWKLLSRGNGAELFNVRDDPGELHDLAAQKPGVAQRLGASGTAKLDGLGVPRGKVKSISVDTVQRLRSLGYLR